MKDRIKMLKVKIKSLAAESRIIRLEELRAKKDAHLQSYLYCHRIHDVRKEQRASLLAYAFLRGRSYLQCEPKCDTPPDWKRVEKLVEKFGVVYGVLPDSIRLLFRKWMSESTVKSNVAV